MNMDKPPVILPKEITFQWSRDFMKLRARRYMSRCSYRLFSAICFGVAALGIAGLLFDPRPEIHTAYIPYLFFPILPVVIYGRRYLVMSRIRHADLNRRVVARIEPESLSIDAGGIVTTLRWQAIKQLWKFPDIFLLFTDTYPPTFVTLPVSELSEETKTFVETKIREQGGQVS
jgi:hypothetical protein